MTALLVTTKHTVEKPEINKDVVFSKAANDSTRENFFLLNILDGLVNSLCDRKTYSQTEEWG